MRTFLTILGVSIGIGAVLFLVSLGYGLQNTILDRITTADALLSLDVSPGVGGLVKLDNQTMEQISKFPEVAEISPVITFTGQMTLEKLTGDCLVNAVDPSFFRLEGLVPQSGRVFTGNYYEALISSAGAKLFSLESGGIIGKEIILNIMVDNGGDDETEMKTIEVKNKFKIIGVIEDENSSFIYLPRETIKDIEYSEYSLLKVKVGQDEFLEPVRAKIVDLGYSVESLTDTIEQANKIFGIIQIVLSLFGIIALFVSAIGMFNTMTIALLERINEIGIMRAIGVTKKDMLFLFLAESSLMGFLGGIGGVLIGWAGGELANFGMNILARTMGGQSLDLFYQPLWFILVIIIFSTVIGFFTGVYPSIRAAKINPLEALRYK